MLPHAISQLMPAGWLRPTACLDIGRSCLQLRVGKTSHRHDLARPLRAGLPDEAQLAALREGCAALFEQSRLGPGRLEVSLSDGLARSWIVERMPGLATPAEVDAMAADQMQQLYGDSAEDAAQWSVQTSAAAFVQHWPAIAVPKVWVELLTELAAVNDCQIAKIETRFVASFNVHRSNPFRSAKPTLHTLETPDGLTVGIRDADAWLGLRTHPPLALLSVDLSAILRRDCHAAGLRFEDCRISPLRWPLETSGR